ncbi:MAG TPA: DNA polymerase [Verrucomicrobiota bacterium]|nr:DNA polymerase [Verrucomicrobiota bacterium]HNU50177.1 DNA polymerase [Verrucomicrobiota bacterium]
MIPEPNILTPEAWAEIECGGTVAVDFETFYTAAYSVAELGLWAYCHDPRFQAYLVAVTDGERTCVCAPSRFPWATIAGRTWVSHHRDFDRSVFERLQEQSAVPSGIAPAIWLCSAALCAYLQHPRDLVGAVKAVFGETLDKGPRERAKGRVPGEDYLLAAEISRYAARDALACLALWNHLERHWPPHERRLFDLTSDMGRHGLAVDWAYVRAKRLELEDLAGSIADALPWKPATSVKQFEAACERIGVPAPPSTSSADPGFARWLKKHIDSDAATWVRHMQRVRSANRTAKVLESMEARRMPSGRMAYELKYFGASTGRWSGGGGLNLQNLNRKTAEGVDLRRAIIAPPGHVLAAVDFSQIESRVLLFLAGDTEALVLFRDNPDADAYEIHARRTMGYAEPEPLKAWCDRTGSNLRQLAKARVLGLGFGCGWRKFIEVARVMAGLELSEDDSKGVVERFRDSNPRIVRLWQRLEDACEARDGDHYALPLPCTQHAPAAKRYVLYRDVHVSDEDITATVAGERVKVYGGLLAENWTQATARDVLASAWLRCACAGFVPVLSVHDELVFELPEATAEANLARIIALMETPLPWAPHLPLKVEGKLMPFYSK